MSYAKQFITIEGTEGVGKSTVFKYIRTLFEENKQPFAVNREPGGTPLAEQIRNILLNNHNNIMCDDTELLLMFACRAQNIAEIIKPALEQGKWVISDRFTDSSFAYQGGGRGLNLDRIKSLAKWVHGDLKPDLTFLLDAPIEVAMKRVMTRGNKDRIEQEDFVFFEKVRQAYLEMVAAEPERFVIIDASQTEENVCSDIAETLKQRYDFHV